MNANVCAVLHVWRPTYEGHDSTAYPGAMGWESSTTGHVALLIRNGGQESYASFWPSEESCTAGREHEGSKGRIVTYDYDRTGEGRDPDVRIPLYGLDITAMKACFDRLKARADSNTILWWCRKKLNTPEGSEKHSCATLVWSLLRVGGIETRYSPSIHGVTDVTLREKYKNDLLRPDGTKRPIAAFDHAFFRKWCASPVLILHLVSSAREKERGSLPASITWENSAFSSVRTVADSPVSDEKVETFNSAEDLKIKEAIQEDSGEIPPPTFAAVSAESLDKTWVISRLASGELLESMGVYENRIILAGLTNGNIKLYDKDKNIIILTCDKATFRSVDIALTQDLVMIYLADKTHAYSPSEGKIEEFTIPTESFISSHPVISIALGVVGVAGAVGAFYLLSQCRGSDAFVAKPSTSDTNVAKPRTTNPSHESWF